MRRTSYHKNVAEVEVIAHVHAKYVFVKEDRAQERERERLPDWVETSTVCVFVCLYACACLCVLCETSTEDVAGSSKSLRGRATPDSHQTTSDMQQSISSL